jgi:hypothetical protein
MPFQLGLPAEDEVLHWDSRLHQYVIVKATAQMPDFLQRQILKHRTEILRGCVDVLKDMPPVEELKDQVRIEFRALDKAIRGKARFSAVCYRLGRLSTLITEIEAPVRALTTSQADSINTFMVSRLQDFPVVIHRIGEKALSEGELRSYLDSIEIRNLRRGANLSTAVRKSEPGAWHDERSAVYGLAQLTYNDMILDTARLWLYAWETVGGDAATAPYFEQ